MSVNLNDSTPAAPAGTLNGLWQKDSSGNVSVNVPDTTNAANITSGLLALTQGGTAADLSATGGAHQVLKQSTSGAVITVGQLAEADLSFTSITTNDVSITKHGFAPILPNDSTKFLNGVGAYAVPPGAGTVTSVTLTVPARQTVSGSPVTTSGPLAISDNTQSANLVFAGPTTGSAAAPTFRALVAADMPAATEPFLAFSFLPSKPGASALVLAVDIPSNLSTVSFPGNFSGSVGKVGTNPTSTAAYDVKQNGSSIGGISISTSGVFTFTTTSGTAKAFAASDELTVVAPSSQDATLSDVRFTLAGTR
jgi:hypothetical protein